MGFWGQFWRLSPDIICDLEGSIWGSFLEISRHVSPCVRASVRPHPLSGSLSPNSRRRFGGSKMGSNRVRPDLVHMVAWRFLFLYSGCIVRFWCVVWVQFLGWVYLGDRGFVAICQFPSEPVAI